MPTTRKKVIKTVYKDDDESEGETGDFSDSGSEARISDESHSEDEESEHATSEEDFVDNYKKKRTKPIKSRNPISIKNLINKVNKQSSEDSADVLISVKDLTDEDKLLPSILNLSESDTSDDEGMSKPSMKITPKAVPSSSTVPEKDLESDEDIYAEYKDVWSQNLQDNSEDVAKKTFMELQEHNTKIEETKASIKNYMSTKGGAESDVKNLLALGEEILPEKNPINKKSRIKKTKVDSDSEAEDWEEVKEVKCIPQQGLQLFVEFPDALHKKKKAVDVEMMMKRKINRTKKEYQVYMHKVHVLCWLGHGNYTSRILNDQEIMAAALSLVPSKECYPGDRVDLKYVEQITSWFKDKLTLKQDKNEDKFKPKAPPLKEILLSQIKSRVATTKKYIVFIFVSMLRALGLQCRVMVNFVTLPLKPSALELCSLSTKHAQKSNDSKAKIQNTLNKDKNKPNEKKKTKAISKTKSKRRNVAQLDGCHDSENMVQIDGSNDDLPAKTRSLRSTKANEIKNEKCSDAIEDVSPPKKFKKSPAKNSKDVSEKVEIRTTEKKVRPGRKKNPQTKNKLSDVSNESYDKKYDLHHEKSLNYKKENSPEVTINKKKTRNNKDGTSKNISAQKQNKLKPPQITITNENNAKVSSTYLVEQTNSNSSRLKLSRKRTHSANSNNSHSEIKTDGSKTNKAAKTRTKSAPGSAVQDSKYFNKEGTENQKQKRYTKNKETTPEPQRISHKDLLASKPKAKNDVTGDLIDIIKNRIKQVSPEVTKTARKDKLNKGTCDCGDSGDDFKPTKLSPRASTSKVIDRRVLSSDEDTPKKRTDVWCEIFVEELEQWICVDVITGKIHDTKFIYNRATQPVCYVVGWDNNNYLKDLTRRYVPHWNTVTRKQRAEQAWWNKAVQPWLGPKTARDREEDEFLDKMQLEAPLPKSIAEYKNHPLYALKRHLLKFEAIYPPDAATLGFVRGEPVYARDCVYVCRSRDTWLKEAKVVRLGETPYKVVKARPKWDKLSNKLITDKPLEVFGPWQVQDYEPPIAENGIVPRNAYGNVELFKQCMLPKGTVHVKLPGLNKVARKLNIDCAPAMTGFDFNGGWSHPVYDGFVVCEEYEEIITEAWVKDQEEQERREREKTDARVYGNWKRLIKGLLIRERIKTKYGFENPTTSQDKSKIKHPRYVAKKK